MQKSIEREGYCRECSSGPMRLDEGDKLPDHHWPLFRNRHCDGSGSVAVNPVNSKNTRGKRGRGNAA